jgi:hypothetical protein
MQKSQLKYLQTGSRSNKSVLEHITLWFLMKRGISTDSVPGIMVRLMAFVTKGERSNALYFPSNYQMELDQVKKMDQKL